MQQLPPEAYTKETLKDAFNWLQGQPESMREIVQTPEHLVSLYLKRQRNDVSSDAPVSSKNFMNELKSLAKGLEEFSPTESNFAEEVVVRPPTPKKKPKPKAPKMTFEASDVSGYSLDSQTIAKIQQVRKRFNLSSESEALRLLVSLGFEKFSEIQ